MIICIADVLSAARLVSLHQQLAEVAFRDGQATAGWHARTVKRNTQADSSDAQVAILREDILNALQNNDLFMMAARPSRIMPVLFSRYLPGMEYGPHIDDAMMQGPDNTIRTDLALTLFLSGPEDYDGGSLIIDTAAGEQIFKLPAGSMLLYPATTLHRVEPVTRGERLAAVGWVQSQIRDASQREILFDLDTTRRQLFNQSGKTPQFDAISKSVANLMRMWADP